ncbi:MAG: D-alanyl-D-alanine carboxypeptidase [Gammaproteobacteria bacterium]|nr:D-alanyl-D-alanine carboxypeptidase [Gammaproteobacteria bacterium]
MPICWRCPSLCEKFFVLLFCFLFSPHASAIDFPEIPSPDIGAPIWLLMDHDSGRVLASSNADKPVAPGRLTQLMTAYVLFGKLKSEKWRLDEQVNVTSRASNAKGAKLFLRPQTTVRAEDLLQGMIVRSATDAALALVEHVSGSETNFVTEMNAAARSLGLNHTTFTNAGGYDETGQVSTARDLSLLASALIRDFPEDYKKFSQKEFVYQEINQYNRNALLWRDSSVDGLKAGFTRNGGYVSIVSAKRDGMRLIATTLGARDENTQVDAGQKLLDYGFRYFETRLLYAVNVPAAHVRVWMGNQSSLPLGLRQNLYLTLPRSWHQKLSARLMVKEMIYAPVPLGQTLGSLSLDIDRQTLAEYPLVALKEISTGNFLQRGIDRIQLWLR